MPYPILLSQDVIAPTEYFKNNEYGYSFPFIFTRVDGEFFILAKSVVRGVIEKDYKYGKDPYIDRIIKLCEANITRFNIDSNKSLILKVWGHTNGHFKDVIFVKVSALLLCFNVIFPELQDYIINNITNQLHCMINKLVN